MRLQGEPVTADRAVILIEQPSTQAIAPTPASLEQAAAADQLFFSASDLSPSELFTLRIEAGSSAMEYHRAMRAWITRD
ncbi:hypothetical protein [Streptomyces collinus]|uniref:hypothetical protein n=1 Tax=Streptomyces collinus TaxID=42684 RepID=UPI0036EAE747